MPAERLIPLPQLPRELTAHTGRQAPGYRRLYMLVLDGRLPAMQVNGRYHVRAADVPAIAEALGLGSSPAIAA